MKRWLINFLYDGLMLLEDFFGNTSSFVNDLRVKLDNKYYFKYVAPTKK